MVVQVPESVLWQVCALQSACLETVVLFFFFQAEDGIRDLTVTGVQTCALPILRSSRCPCRVTILGVKDIDWIEAEGDYVKIHAGRAWHLLRETMKHLEAQFDPARFVRIDRKSTRLNSSHSQISYAVFCLKKKKVDTLLDTSRSS